MEKQEWPEPIRASEPDIDEPDEEAPPLVVRSATTATIAGVVGAIMPPWSILGTIGFVAYLLGALCGLVVGITVATYRYPRPIGIACALVSLGMLALFPFVMFKGGLMGDG